MKYFIRVRKNGQLIKSKHGILSTLNDADIIARHESREKSVDIVEVVDDKGVVKRSYKVNGKKILKKNPSVSKKSNIYLIQVSDNGKTWQSIMELNDETEARKIVSEIANIKQSSYIRLIEN